MSFDSHTTLSLVQLIFPFLVSFFKFLRYLANFSQHVSTAKFEIVILDDLVLLIILSLPSLMSSAAITASMFLSVFVHSPPYLHAALEVFLGICFFLSVMFVTLMLMSPGVQLNL